MLEAPHPPLTTSGPRHEPPPLRAVLNRPLGPLDYRADVRDLRVDFFRGIALYMILVDHVAGDPIARFTYHKFGFSDGAKIFVSLSGVSCGIVYSRVLVRRGWTSLMPKIARRAALIYAYYVLSSIAIILLLTDRVGVCDWQFPISIFIFSFIEISIRSRLVPHLRCYSYPYERKSICRPPLAFLERCLSRGDLC
jgi:hypothetical protein